MAQTHIKDENELKQRREPNALQGSKAPAQAPKPKREPMYMSPTGMKPQSYFTKAPAQAPKLSDNSLLQTSLKGASVPGGNAGGIKTPAIRTPTINTRTSGRGHAAGRAGQIMDFSAPSRQEAFAGRNPTRAPAQLAAATVAQTRGNAPGVLENTPPETPQRKEVAQVDTKEAIPTGTGEPDIDHSDGVHNNVARSMPAPGGNVPPGRSMDNEVEMIRGSSLSFGVPGEAERAPGFSNRADGQMYHAHGQNLRYANKQLTHATYQKPSTVHTNEEGEETVVPGGQGVRMYEQGMSPTAYASSMGNALSQILAAREGVNSNATRRAELNENRRQANTPAPGYQTVIGPDGERQLAISTREGNASNIDVMPASEFTMPNAANQQYPIGSNVVDDPNTGYKTAEYYDKRQMPGGQSMIGPGSRFTAVLAKIGLSWDDFAVVWNNNNPERPIHTLSPQELEAEVKALEEEMEQKEPGWQGIGGSGYVPNLIAPGGQL